MAAEALVEEELQEVGKMEDLKCPRCDKVMEKIKKADVIIDVCRECQGMWLDKGEMERLAKYGKEALK